MFRTTQLARTDSKPHMNRLIILIIATVILTTASVVQAQSLVHSEQDLPGLLGGDAAWADHDGDGDLDLALIGQAVESDQVVPSAFIFDNQSGLFSENQSGSNLIGVYRGAVAWADYDNDGDNDLVVAGWDAKDEEFLGLYNNDKIQGGFFKDDLQLDSNGEKVFVGVRYSSLSWGDVDNDGDLDLVVMGMESGGTSLTALYRNANGRFALDELNSETLVNLHNGSLAWGDYDGDGDIDLAISGDNVVESSISGLNAVSEFYLNGPGATLELDTAMGDAISLKGGSLAWGDYDGDGNIDLAASGRPFGKFDGSDWTAKVVLYRNRPTGLLSFDENFTLGASLSAVGDLSWVDFDNDGDVDLATSGRTVLSSYSASVFLNNDGLLNGVSQESELYGLDGGSTDWVDYNGDGRADLLISGMSEAGERFTDLYVNQGTAPRNSDPSPPLTLNEPKVTSSGVIFSWSAGSDSESDILSYNLRVGSDSAGEDIVVSGVENSAGNVGFKINRSLLKSLAPDQYFWSVQAVDGANARSVWSQEQILNIGQFVDSDQRLRALKESAMAWGDVDGDGDADVVMSGQNRSGDAQTLFYTNENKVLQLNAQSQLKSVKDGDLSWGDYDNDGDLDLAMTGEDSFGNPQSILYGFGDGIFVSIGSFEPVSSSSIDWGDYDNDGDLDVVLSGQSTEIENGRLKSVTKIYENDGEGSFLFSSELTGLKNGEVSWGDFDSDGDVDLVTSGVNVSDERMLTVFGNENGILTDLALGLPGVESSDLAWGDYDGDGDLDLASTGIAENGLVTEVYVNDANGGLVSLEASLVGVKGGDIVWGDYDNDRDLDLIVTGNDGEKATLLVYENTVGRTSSTTPFEIDSSVIQFLQGVEFSATALIDIDADGDLDLVSSGSTGGFDPQPRTVVNDNLEAQFNSNRAPEVPTTNQAIASEDRVSLSWLTAEDDGEDSPLSLTYDLRVGKSFGGNEVLSGAVDFGLGQIGTATSHVLNNLSSGFYYWSVRTVDDGFARSIWSEPLSFIIDTVPPTLADYSISESVLGIGQTTTLALGFEDEHAGVSLSKVPTVELVGNDGRRLFTQLQFSGPAWTGNLTVDENFSSGDYVVEISGVEDNKGNKMLANVADAVIKIDAERPALLSSEPFNGEQNVATTINELNLKFSEPMDEGTISSATFVLKRDGTILDNVPEPQYISESNTVRFFPMASILAGGSNYSLEISASVKDLVGNRPFDATVVSFRTKVPDLISSVPADGAEVGSDKNELNAIFDVAIDPVDLESRISVIKNGQTISLIDVEFNSANRTLRAVIEEGLRAGTAYTVRISSAVGGPMRQSDYEYSFTTAIPRLEQSTPMNDATEVDADIEELSLVFSAPVDATQLNTESFLLTQFGSPVSLRDGDPIARGDNIYGLAPADGWDVGTRYELQVSPSVEGPLGSGRATSLSFSTKIPQVISRFPAKNDTAIVDMNALIRAKFDGGLDEETLRSDGAVVLLQSGVSLDISEPAFDPVTNELSFSALAGLLPGTAYSVQIDPGIGGALQVNGSAYNWDFASRIPNPVATFPEAGAVTSAGDQRLVVVFSGPLNPALINSQHFRLRRGGSLVALDSDGFSYDAETFTVRYPLIDLRAGSSFSADVQAAVSGPLATNIGLEDLSWSFDTEIPSVLSTSPMDGSDGVSLAAATLNIVFSGPVASQNEKDFQIFSRSVGINEATEQVVKITGFGADTTGTAISFSIDGGLKPFTEYRIIMDRMVLGERAQEGFEWRFTTATSVADVASGGTIKNASGTLEMYFPPSALEIGNNEVAIQSNMSSREIDQRSDIYLVRTGQEVLNKPATLTIRYTDSDAEGLDDNSQLRFTIKQRAKDGTWKLIGGNVDLAKKSVRTSVEELGEFAIFEDSDADIGSLAIADLDCQPRAFSPNGGSLRDLTDISFDLNNAANITVRVFSSSGSLERVIIKDRQMARGRASIEWDGLDEDRKVVASGLYVVVVSSGNTSSEKIVAVVR